MPVVKWYEPTDRGLEERIRERLERLRGLDRETKKKK
jgi:replication-associated recombination protein RarA